MSKTDTTKYPYTIFCNYHSQAGGQIYGSYSNEQLDGTRQENKRYIRADIYERERHLAETHEQTLKDMHPQWHDASKELPETPKRLLVQDAFGEIRVADYADGTFTLLYTKNTKGVVAWMELPRRYRPTEK